jgi:protein-S-isoprenylcysteine O-methyltransferase Ste14
MLLMNPYVGISLVMEGFGVFHSLTARPAIKMTICARSGIGAVPYAMARTLISFSLLVLSLILLFKYAPGTPRIFQPIFGLPAIIPTLFAIWIAGTALGQVAKSRRLPQVFGLKESPKVFFYSGAYGLCRHPMYSGWLIASWGMLLSKPYLLTVVYNALMTVYVVYESRQEEKQMVALFGDKYRDYRHQVPFLIPLPFRKRP